MGRAERALHASGTSRDDTWRKTLLERLADVDEQLHHPFYQEPDVFAAQTKAAKKFEGAIATGMGVDDLSEPLARLIRQLEPEKTETHRRILLPAVANAIARCRISQTVHQCAILSLSLCLTASVGFVGALVLSDEATRFPARANAAELPKSAVMAMYDPGERDTGVHERGERDPGKDLEVTRAAADTSPPPVSPLAMLRERLSKKRTLAVVADISRSSEFALPLDISWPDASRANAELRISGIPPGLFPTIGEQIAANAVSLPLSDLPLLRLLSNRDTPNAFDLELVVEDKAANLEERLTVAVDLKRMTQQQDEQRPPSTMRTISSPAMKPVESEPPKDTIATARVANAGPNVEPAQQASQKLMRATRMAVGRAPGADEHNAAPAPKAQRSRAKPAQAVEATAEQPKPVAPWWQKPQPDWAPWKQ